MIKFNQHGHLQKTVTLSYKEFGFNESRKEKTKRLLLFLKILRSLGCKHVYIVGSVVSNKEFPNDIDLCADATEIDYMKLTKQYPEFMDQQGIEKIKKEHNVHLIFFDETCTEYLDWFRKDRDDNPRGLVKIPLNDIDNYD